MTLKYEYGVGGYETIVGKKFPRVDAYEKVTGLGKYTGDIIMPNMLYGVLIRSPYAHAKVISVDTKPAECIKGVRSILTYHDMPNRPFNLAAHDNILAFPPTKPVEDQYLFNQKVRFVGEIVAAVAAESLEAAFEAADVIEICYESIPAVYDPREAMSTGAPIIHEEVENNILLRVSRESGDPDGGFSKSDKVAEATYITSRQKHCQMEPNACVARYSESGTLTVWSPTQMPHLVRGLLAKLFDLPIHRVRILSPLIGGGFGGRLGMVVEPYAAALSLKNKGVPVKIQHERKEDFFGSESRHPAIIYLKIGGKEEGSLEAVQLSAITNTGAYATHGPGVTNILVNTMPGPYRCENMKLEGYCVYTNTPISGAFRGFGGVQSAFAMESQIDELCEMLHVDPVEFRIKNLKKIGDDYRGSPIASCGIAECITLGAERIGWKKKRAQKDSNKTSKSKGVGMACCMWVSGGQPTRLDATTSIVKMNEDGSVNLLMGCTDLGTGSKTTLSQICAEELGVAFDDIHVIYGDTDVTPFDVGSHASRTCYVAGGAVLLASRDIKSQILKEAARVMKANATELDIKEKIIFIKNSPEKKLHIKELAQLAHYNGKQFVGKASNSPYISPPSFYAQFAEVEVDLETGKVNIVSFVAAVDCGRAIHPEIVKGQITGGIHQGIGFALTEEFCLDKKGRSINPTFTDYKILTAIDMPKVEVILVETIEPSGPFGAKSAGEAAMVPTAPAIANAIYHATGVRPRELPISSERLFGGINKKNIK